MVHRVLEEGGGCEHEHPDGWIDEGDDVEGGNESGEFPDVGEVFERFHGDRGAVVHVVREKGFDRREMLGMMCA